MNPEYIGLQSILTTHLQLSGALLPVQFQLQAKEAQAVYLIGEMTDWLAAPIPMQQDKTGCWQITLHLRQGQWLYKFLVDGKILADPANPLRAADGLGGYHSYLLVGDGDWAARHSTRYGELVQIEIASKIMQGPARFQLYLPPAFSLARQYNLLYLLHGYRTEVNQWASNGCICQFMGNLEAQHLIQPFVVVMPATISQEKADLYSQFLGGELYDWLHRHFPLVSHKAATAVAGMSQFSLNAFELARQFPHRFGFCAPVSAFFSQQYLQQISQLVLSAPFALRLYCGTEDYVFARNQRFTEILRKNGIAFDYLPVSGEHSWHYWNSITRDLLIAVSEFFSGQQIHQGAVAAAAPLLQAAADAVEMPGQPAENAALPQTDSEMLPSIYE